MPKQRMQWARKTVAIGKGGRGRPAPVINCKPLSPDCAGGPRSPRASRRLTVYPDTFRIACALLWTCADLRGACATGRHHCPQEPIQPLRRRRSKLLPRAR